MLKDIKHIHFIGIGGYGMSALARVLLRLGYTVSGSDMKTGYITEKLQAEGATVFDGHDESYLAGAELVVYSTAIPEDNPELAAARKRGIPLWHRSEMLARFINDRFGIAIAGAHGKTTTTSMTALVLTRGGLDPTAFIGGVLRDFKGNARIGSSDLVVAEADESDNSFLRYTPSLAVVTNVEPDHLEHYNGDFNLLLDAYRKFLSHIKPGGTAVLYAGDAYLAGMHLPHLKNMITYGFDSGDYRAVRLRPEGWGTRFDVVHQDEILGEIKLHVPGKHNVANALAAIAVARELKVPFDAIRRGLEDFRGADRRFQFLFRHQGLTVVDDYAHHPTEVQATLKAARSDHSGRLIAIFQPHRYTRTQWFFDQFAAAFDNADKVFLHKIYAAGEAPIPGVTAAELARRMKERGVDVTQLDDAAQIEASVVAMARPGDLIITMGAGDVTEMGHRIAGLLREKANDIQ